MAETLKFSPKGFPDIAATHGEIEQENSNKYEKKSFPTYFFLEF